MKSQFGAGRTFPLEIDGGDFAGVELLTDLTRTNTSPAVPADKWQNIPLHGRSFWSRTGPITNVCCACNAHAAAEVVIAENGQMAVDLAIANNLSI